MITDSVQLQTNVNKRRLDIVTSVLFLFFLFLLFTSSDLRLGGVAIRYILVVILLIDAVLIKYKFYFDKTITLYLLFLFVFGFSSLIKGYFSNFFSQLYYSYAMSIIGCVFVIALLKRDFSFIRPITFLILAIGAFDVVVTFSQFVFKDDWYRPIEQILHLPTWAAQEGYGYKQVRLEVMDVALPGIFGNGVFNGYFLGVCSILSMVFVVQSKKVLYYVLPVFYLLGTFVCQQRGPLFISLFVIVLISFRLFKAFSGGSRAAISVLFVLFAFVVFYRLSDISSNLGLRYSSTGLDSTGRSYIARNTLDYIMDHPFIANFYELVEEKGHAPHNLILNAYVYGGILSFFIIIYMLYLQFKTFFRIVRGSIEGFNAYYYVFAWSWAGYTLNGLLHNRSIITGDFTIWLIWGVLLAYPLFHPYVKK